MTILLSRAESLNQSTPPPDAADLEQWQRTFTYLFSVLSSSLLTLFPSTRMAASVPFGVAQYQSVDALRPEADFDDEPVWRFLAAVAVCADPDQQQVLVTSVRDKVIEGVKGAKMGRGGPEISAIKIVSLPFFFLRFSCSYLKGFLMLIPFQTCYSETSIFYYMHCHLMPR